MKTTPPPHLLNLNGITLAVSADSATPSGPGYILKGSTVNVLHPFSAVDFYRHGFHSWSLSTWIPLDRPLPQTRQPKVAWSMLDHVGMIQSFPFTGSGVGALRDAEGRVLLLGALGLDAFVKTTDTVLSGSCTDSDKASPAWFLAFGAEDEVFAQYAKQLEDHLGRRKSPPPPRIWCSWYSLFTDIDETGILQILEGVKDLSFDVFQIDDGWQLAMGDWDVNAKFPSGMSAMARRIQAAGFQTGLWLAPFIVQPKSSLYRDHPDWLLRDEQGDLIPAGHCWGSVFYGLDTTHPDVLKWIGETIARVRAWGYDYLKLDFLYAAAMPAKRHRNVGGEEAYRLGLEAVRKAAGDDAYLLVCGAPILSSLGLADAARIGPDVTPMWDNEDRVFGLQDFTGPSTLNALRTTLGRLWLKPLLHVDPDVFFFRQRYNLMNPAQNQLLRDMATITGFKATSDLPAWLDPSERDALESFLNETSTVTKLGPYEYAIDGRLADFHCVRKLWAE